MTARISASKFYYIFKVNPDQKFIRLHFYPSSSYSGFESSQDFFTKTSSRIYNSPSLFTKDKSFYAFVNGIEIISIPTQLVFINYTMDGDLGARIVGQNDLHHYNDNSTALEMVQRLNVGGSSISCPEKILASHIAPNDEKEWV
ncbi:hypothetical protein M9H77_34473 [Catharanthus roseus]|uniref:Uncharacterized protein n=1 Tax=Catharanthus roseus TaxID=4058 RepID=A0ACB9ZLK0_CATRO|nr:hypothetical protein M9H77_34473 [Catharanthus roseus]